MNKPEALARKTIYLIALDKVENNPEEFICHNIIRAYESIFEFPVFDDDECLMMFPEFINQKPAHIPIGDSWFSSMTRDSEAQNKRIQVLRNAIKSITI